MPIWEILHRYDFSMLPPLSQVPKVLNPPADVFTRYFVPQAAPIVITDSPVFSSGPRTLEDVVRRDAGKLQVNVRGGDYADVNKRQKERMALSEYVEMYVRPAERKEQPDDSGDLPRYAGNTPLSREEFETLGFRYPECFEGKEFIEPRLWFGPRGSLTPLHYDETANLVCQYIGKKHFPLFPPSQIPYLYPRGSGPTWSNVADPRRPDLEKYPLFAQARPVEVTLNAGEMLFLPAFWAHFVVNLDTSLMVNFWPRYGSPQKYKSSFMGQVARVKRRASRDFLRLSSKLYANAAAMAARTETRRVS